MAKTPERMTQGKQQPKFERNPCINFRHNCATDGQTDGRTTGRREKVPYHDLCRQSQAYLKIVKNRNIKISKIQNSTFVKTTEKKIQEKIEKLFEGGVAF